VDGTSYNITQKDGHELVQSRRRPLSPIPSNLLDRQASLEFGFSSTMRPADPWSSYPCRPDRITNKGIDAGRSLAAPASRLKLESEVTTPLVFASASRFPSCLHARLRPPRFSCLRRNSCMVFAHSYIPLSSDANCACPSARTREPLHTTDGRGWCCEEPFPQSPHLAARLCAARRCAALITCLLRIAWH
jgi:hypothetical protein